MLNTVNTILMQTLFLSNRCFSLSCVIPTLIWGKGSFFDFEQVINILTRMHALYAIDCIYHVLYTVCQILQCYELLVFLTRSSQSK